MGIAVLKVPPPASMNAGGDWRARHRRKKRAEASLAWDLLAARVPQPIPGDRVHATAVILFPTRRGRDEDNYRSNLQKALGDALDPHDREAPHRWLSNDTPDHFTMGEVRFGLTEMREWKVDGKTKRKRAPALAVVTLLWGDDIPGPGDAYEQPVPLEEDPDAKPIGRAVTLGTDGELIIEER